MNLTTLYNFKAWANITTPTDDLMLNRLIKQMSQMIFNYIQRPSLARTTYTELRNGVGNRQMTLRNWPVVSVASVAVGPNFITSTTAVPPSTGLATSGYTLQTWDGESAGQPQVLSLLGYTFVKGQNNVQIVYDAGYCVTNKPATVPSSAAYQITMDPSQGSWAQDDGVYYASSNVKLTPVTTVPSIAGQYQVVVNSQGSVTYNFSSADAGQSLLLNYSYIPADLEQLTIEWMLERYKYKERVGQRSKSLGGSETASYNLAGMPDFVKVGLESYRKRVPI